MVETEKVECGDIAIFPNEMRLKIGDSIGTIPERNLILHNNNLIMQANILIGTVISEFSRICVEIRLLPRKVNRLYTDLITNTIISKKSDFIEKLTHDCYVVQISRIQPKLQSKLEVLLTIFEQNYFTDDKEITKDYSYKIDDDLIKNIVDILHHAGTDPIERLEIEKEQEALRVFDAGMRELKQTISEKDKELTEKDKLIEELLRKLGEK